MSAGRRALALVLAALVALGPLPAGAATAPSLAGRILIDGFPTEYTPDEAVFSLFAGVDEESAFDSAWGPDNDFNQMHVTWDRDSIYVTGEGVTWGNNMMIFFDVVPDRGLSSMRQLNAWSRNFTFSEDFRPDLFVATWDGNTSPQLWIHQGGQQVLQVTPGTGYRGAATFSTSQRGRAMEFAIPWNTFFLGSQGLGATPTFVPALDETVHVFTPGTEVRIAGVITAGSDNLGGPDSAPDNTRGHVSDGAQEVLIDNYARVALDEADDTGLGGGGPDGVADWNIEPQSRVTFRFQPPVVPVRLKVVDLSFDRPAFAPSRGEKTRFRFGVDPPANPADSLSVNRTLQVSANVFDSDGRFVRNLFLNETRTAGAPGDPAKDFWDGRDDQGELMRGGVYIVRLVVEPNLDRTTRAVVVVR